MNRDTLQRSLVFVILAAAAVAARFYFRDLPNFAPVAALALFAGCYFRSAIVAVALPLVVMIVSDQFLGGYHWALMLTVYGMLAAPVLCRTWLRGALAGPATWTNGLKILGCGLGASIAFFVATNFATWCFSELYPTTTAGLIECYVQAIPFFRFTLAGDLTFTTVLFGGWALLRSSHVTRPVLQVE